jgi:uncharacterized membrane protein
MAGCATIKKTPRIDFQGVFYLFGAIKVLVYGLSVCKYGAF